MNRCKDCKHVKTPVYFERCSIPAKCKHPELLIRTFDSYYGIRYFPKDVRFIRKGSEHCEWFEQKENKSWLIGKLWKAHQ